MHGLIFEPNILLLFSFIGVMHLPMLNRHPELISGLELYIIIEH